MTESPLVTVEFLGIVRQRAGDERGEFAAKNLRELWRAVAEQYPQLEGVCLDAGTLKNGYLASIDGRRFTRNSEESLSPGEHILLLSADAGG
ncbi:MAG: MoaD/ThiS family protein [Planctomycetaceae bacterium]|nr:MoaD/ThiS family protein [Planctomycetaceae bacterium]